MNFSCAHGKSHGHGQNIMGVPVTVAMGNAYYVFFVPMVIATGMPNGPMPKVMGMPVTMCTGTSTIGKHGSWIRLTVIPVILVAPVAHNLCPHHPII